MGEPLRKREVAGWKSMTSIEEKVGSRRLSYSEEI
jgi:hypothetical protein